MKRGILSVTGLCLFVIFSSGLCFGFDEGDFQCWHTGSITWKTAQNWNLKWEQEFRFGDNADDYYFWHSDLSATYSGFADWFDIGIGYRQIFEEKGNDWQEENRPQLDATLKFMLNSFKISNRGRLEYRNKPDADNSFRYRNKLTLTFPFKLTRFKIQPYVADEVFADFDVGEMNRNRLYCGFNLEPVEHLKIELYYLWQESKKSGNWSDCNVLGTKLKLSF
ncbi:MAG: DUF2490 domain-containing protein [Candidatus Omnitrophica bacterium]|nr:DUF2490 domain-containing protein [Candidatus Omnitrophota bacterium]